MTSRGQPNDDLDAWLSETAQRVLGYAVTLVQNRAEAEDIVHDCYSRLLAKRDEYDLPGEGTKLLFRSVTNACINALSRRRPEVSLDQLQNTGSPKMADRSTPEPIQLAMQNELQRAVEQAMQGLPAAQRAAVELRSLGHSLAEVAEMLDVSHSNARVLLHRGRQTLEEKLRPLIEETVK